MQWKDSKVRRLKLPQDSILNTEGNTENRVEESKLSCLCHPGLPAALTKEELGRKGATFLFH